MKQRNATIDSLRGLAALLVLASHVGTHLSSAWNDVMLYRFDLGQVGVIVFFLISGYIIPQSITHGRKVFWIRRFFRLYPLYWLNLALIGGSAWALLANATMLESLFGVAYLNFGAWTLAIELAFYILITIVPNVPPARMILILLLIKASSDVFGPTYPLLPYLAILYCGAAIREKKYMPVLICMLFVAFSPHVLIYERAHSLPRVLAFAVFIIALRLSRAPRPLVWVGERSYSLYLFHPLVIDWLPAVLWLPGSLALSALLYRAIEQPSIAIGRRCTSTPCK